MYWSSSYWICLFFDQFATSVFGNNTWLYTAYPNGNGGYEIPFLVWMGFSFFITVGVMVAISLAGPKINPKSFAIDASMFKLKPQTTAMVVAILLLLTALYIKFW